ncbi:MAG: hypothetical protein A3F26_02625 [Candidatus Ryanbacteria bacterium RIFCSPHIGHO2_12_FULL_47_12b]|uniref:YprB ribonuclease H-like domain-containing protein n=1 Tax=Candidatus Ryanbacteria bacterium RIFCSPLOWO2_12_FULL_47_9c TaxID=1802131 RepID=A0A1G2H6V6_9BACT|nr:MAG: Helicase family protein with metal-binding cysteine cluster [Parcubacteria group bacterium GW2011_GWA2_47_10b]OGZ52139.1 MAG: hypothetical protein A3F26_02625 [Candidatus Ryanbacteria bacterium RIFCSPHIGHO2_12_FULL_47_12b]OGZ57678.1 MAG: hypothetical protein A3G60_00790 [Candidatus Ryanbacteria bacterium RIFCSPLOWO2_12_FULL_47_9c]
MNAIVLDLETEKEFREVGGKHNIHLLGISVVGIYEYAHDRFVAYERPEFGELEPLLVAADFLIGFNINHFDLPVLAPHVHFDVKSLRVLDLMDDVEKALGFRVSLDNLCQATLGARKSGNGLEALWWWRQGMKDKVREYCLSDVRLTRDLYEHGKNKGFILADTRDRGRVRIPVTWGAVLPEKKEIQGAYVQRSLI